jgi:hypothetical protein
MRRKATGRGISNSQFHGTSEIVIRRAPTWSEVRPGLYDSRERDPATAPGAGRGRCRDARAGCRTSEWAACALKAISGSAIGSQPAARCRVPARAWSRLGRRCKPGYIWRVPSGRQIARRHGFFRPADAAA